MTTAPFNIRRCEPRDTAAAYEVCLRTGDNGNDATALYEDPNALGHLYVGPYLKLEPDLASVLEDDAGVCGYVLGAL
ncbi:MAG TPA: GNAT family N-acetyltransferase, partial [Candidatus Nitrosotalea sp.]|nr:GNAT family N-acetyltransferase [Candidatus Nitrosotalea sp.]